MSLGRCWQHLTMAPWRLRQAFSAQTLDAIEAAVRDCETRHPGEIRFAVEGALPLLRVAAGLSPRERAAEVFAQLRVWDTEHNNGVLIYLLLAEHRIEVLADRGIHRRAGAERWAQVVARMGEAFRAGQFEQGLMTAIDTIDALLVEHFPLAAGEANPNELPDAPVIG